MPNIQNSTSLNQIGYELKAAPAAAPASGAPAAPKAEVYGPPAPKDDVKLQKQGHSEAQYAFVAPDQTLAGDKGDLLDDIREKIGDKAFFGAAGAGMAGALAAGKKVDVSVKVEDRVHLPHARVELSVALKENGAARELRENPSQAYMKQQLGYPSGGKPYGAGVKLGFKTEF